MPRLAWLAMVAAPIGSAEDAPDAGAAATFDASPAAGMAPASADRNDSRLEAYRRRYEEALAKRQYHEAETAAKQLITHLVESGERHHGPMADALSDLAFAQRQLELYAPAIRNYQAAIERLEAGANRLSASLVAPLRDLADTYVASGRPDLGLQVYRRALHVRHVNDGPHTLEQIGILDAMATALAESGDADAALRAVDRMRYLYARAFSPRSEEVLPALHRKAGLLNELGRHHDERRVYRDIVKIVEDHRGRRDPGLFDTYLALGHTYFYDLDEAYFRSEPTTETGETFLERALEIAESDPQATWQMEARALLALADYYTLRDVQDRARIHYRRAWRLLSADEQRLDVRRRELERVRALIGANLDPVADVDYASDDLAADPADYAEGYVVVRFRVTDRGRVRGVEIADADPDGLASMETQVVQAVRDLIYRPRYDKGNPAATSGHLFRHDFRYLERGLRAERDAGQ